MRKFVVSMCLCLFASVFVGGCTSGGKGAVTVLHWDSRSAEQLEACDGQDNPVYNDSVGSARSSEKALPAGWWDALMKMITGIRVRIDVIRVEWNEPKVCPGVTNAVSSADCLSCSDLVRTRVPMDVEPIPDVLGLPEKEREFCARKFQVPADPKKTLVVGDSWAAGHVGETQSDDGWPVMMGVPSELRQGIDGSRACDWAADVGGCLTKALATPCEAVLVSLGGNDAFSAWNDKKITTAEYLSMQTSLSNVVAKLETKGVPIYVMKYSTAPQASWPDLIGLMGLNLSIQLACPETVVPVQSSVSLSDPVCWCPADRIHPSLEGHRRLASYIEKVVKTGGQL